MKRVLTVLMPLTVLLLAIGGYFLISQNYAKQAYVINQQLFDGFKGKQQLESKLKALRQSHKSILDSLALVIRTDNNISLVTHYNRLEEEYTSQEEQMSATYTAEIWKQINQYISSYGKDNGFDFIYGAAGEGTLMYASEANNITEEVILYINQKYEDN